MVFDGVDRPAAQADSQRSISPEETSA